jgi:glycerol kinase
MLPEVKDCADDFGITEKNLFGAEIPILGVAGDQHAATIGQACFEPGMMKSTYGTGCFALLNTGKRHGALEEPALDHHCLPADGKTTYALEGSIFIAGAAVQWLRDGLKVIGKAEQTGKLAARSRSDAGTSIWCLPSPARRAALGCRCTRRHFRPDAQYRSGGVCPRRAGSRLLPDARPARRHAQGLEGASAKTVLRVDGGMVASDWTMQRLADLLDAPVDRPTILETTALGAAWLAGSRAGVWPNQKDFAKSWARDQRFEPTMDEKTRAGKLKGWRNAVKRTLSEILKPDIKCSNVATN